MQVRMIKDKDLATVAEYEKEISIISFGDEAVTDLEFHKKKLEKAIPKEKEGMLVLEDEQGVCGWLWMAVKINFVTNDKYVNFKSFYIKDTLRGTDAAKILLQTGMDYCKKSKVTSITGKVHVSNLPMRVLYKSFGFEPTHMTMEYKL